ncbi:MAG: response regulator [Spirochaetales bacterium]|nr:response regulator [Spirochaetales bacterium]
MKKSKSFTLLTLIYLLLFSSFVFFYERWEKRQIQSSMEYHSHAVSNALWELHTIRISDYIDLASHDSSCHSIQLFDNYSREAIKKAVGPEQPPLTKLFIKMGIIGTREYQTPIIYGDRLIGELKQIRYHKNIFVNLIVLFILTLLFLVVILIINLLEARRELETKVQTRTADLSREVESRKKAEEDLSVILNSIGDGVVMVNRQGKILSMNPTAEKLSGWTEEEATGKPIDEVCPLHDDLTNEELKHPVEEILTTERTVNLSLQPLLNSRREESYRLSESGSPVLSPEDEVIGAVIVFRNISEEYELQKKLQQNQKMEALGQLAGGIAHDFNNLLAGIINASDLIGLAVKGNENATHLNELVVETAYRAGDLIKKLLAFAREKPPTLSTVEVNAIIRESVEMLGRTINRNITIQEELTEEPLHVLGDHSLLQSVIMNLSINASHAMPEGGDLFLKTSKARLDVQYCQMSQFELEPGQYCELIVEDTGSGISRKLLEKIFDPFFTTKEQGKGTGLGLSAAYGTVRQYKGEIKVYSELGKGTSFHIFLPLTEVEETIKVEQSREYIHGSGTILIVDDEEVIRKTTQSLLEYLGYTVITAENGLDGLEKITQPIDLVILDMNMPVMDGKTCFFKIKEIKSDLPIIVASGFSQHSGWSDLAENKADGFLVKPFKGFELGQLIHKILN